MKKKIMHDNSYLEQVFHTLPPQPNTVLYLLVLFSRIEHSLHYTYISVSNVSGKIYLHTNYVKCLRTNKFTEQKDWDAIHLPNKIKVSGVESDIIIKYKRMK